MAMPGEFIILMIAGNLKSSGFVLNKRNWVYCQGML